MRTIKNIFFRILSVNSDFEKLFFKKEYSSLTEEFGINFYTILAILLLTFSAFSFSLGSLDYLSERMNDPFTNWVDVPVTPDVRPVMKEIEDFYNDEKVKGELSLDNITHYSLFWRQFLDYDFNDTYQLKGRTIEDTSSLLTKIIEPKNLVYKNPAFEINTSLHRCGIIITEETYNFLNRRAKNKTENVFMEIDEGVINLPVAAVVKHLPDNAEFMFSNKLYNATFDPFRSGMIVNKETSNIIKILSPLKIENDIFILLENKGYKISSIRINEDRFDAEEKKIYSIIFSKPYLWEVLIKSINSVLKSHTSEYAFFWDNECPANYSAVLLSPHKIAFNFSNLNKIRDFHNSMKSKFGVEVNMSQIEAKENFSLVSKLTFILGLILFLFSLVSIVLFINSILTKHLQKIKANLGTLKAFGTDNNTLNRIYLKIIFTFILFAGVLAYIGNTILSVIINVFLTAKMMKFDSIYILVIFILIIVFSLLYSKFSILRILNNTPGNLIYNRK